jgi:hypothetical protein
MSFEITQQQTFTWLGFYVGWMRGSLVYDDSFSIMKEGENKPKCSIFMSFFYW